MSLKDYTKLTKVLLQFFVFLRSYVKWNCTYTENTRNKTVLVVIICLMKLCIRYNRNRWSETWRWVLGISVIRNVFFITGTIQCVRYLYKQYSEWKFTYIGDTWSEFNEYWNENTRNESGRILRIRGMHKNSDRIRKKRIPLKHCLGIHIHAQTEKRNLMPVYLPCVRWG